VLIRRGDRTYQQLSEALGVNSWTLRDWYRKDEMAKKSKSRKASVVASAPPANETPEQEVARLRREVERQRKRIATLEMDRVGRDTTPLRAVRRAHARTATEP
jgi:hypothetical protein